jgi:uncharacterized protein with GYD domain
MPIFVVLAKFTAEGVKEIKKSKEWFKNGQEIAKSVGAEVKSMYYTMGRYDYVAIVEAPSVEASMKALFMLGSVGIAKTETLVGLSMDDALKVVSEIP